MDEKLVASIQRVSKELVDSTSPIFDWDYSFRASAMPVCQWYTTFSKLCGEDPPAKLDTFMSDFYRSVGITVHKVMQRWLGKVGCLYGDWKCVFCGHIERNLGFPKKCPNVTTNSCRNKASTDWEYEEFKLAGIVPDAGIASAHCDGLMRFPWMEPDTYYLIDIKTCSLKNVEVLRNNGFSKPYQMKYLTQTAIYTHLLTKIGFKLVGTVFLMVPRDKPTDIVPVFYHQNKMSEHMFNQAIIDHKASLEAATTGDMTTLVKNCTNKNDEPECPFHELYCFNRKASKYINELFATNNIVPRLPILL